MRTIRAAIGFLVLSCFCIQTRAVNTYSGTLGANFYKWNRPATVDTLSGQSVYFQAIFFTVQGSSPGTVSATITANGFTPRLQFYQNASFDPYNPLFNLWCTGSGSLSAPNIATGVAIPHLLIVCGTNPGDVGTFTVTFSGPGAIDVDPNNDSSLLIRKSPTTASILTGQSTTLNVWASGRQPHKFQWYYGPKPASTNAPDPTKAILNATNQTFNTGALNATTNYWVLVTGNNTSPTNARSSLATVNVSAAPANFSGSLTTQHDTWNRMQTNNVSTGRICYFEVTPFRVFSAGSYTITINTVGFPGTINLYSGKFFPETPAVNFLENGVADDVAGSLSYTTILQPGDYDMVISTLLQAQTGTYSGQITGPSVVQLLPKPTIPSFLNLPGNKTIMTNTTATMSFSVEGAIPRTNQWYRGVPPDASQPIAGATGKSYTTPILPTVSTNYYWVKVSNSYGATTSGPVRVKVVDGPIKFGGTLRPGNKLFYRSNGSGGLAAQPSHYKTYVFEATTLGTYTVTLTSTIGIDASVYQSVFLTNNPNVNLYLLPNVDTFSLPVVAPGTFWLVISAPNLAQAGTYSGTITGPGLVNEFPAPAFAPQPAPTNQFLWRNEDPAPIIGNAIPDSSWSWYYGVAPGVAVDNSVAIAGLNTRTNDPPASLTSPAGGTNIWFWARIDGSYGYDDSVLSLLEVSPPPRFMVYPTNQTAIYGNFPKFVTVVTNAPFMVRWFRGTSPNETNTVQSDIIQAYGGPYIRAVTKTNTAPLLDVGAYSYWLQSTNPSGGTNGPNFTLTVTPRPLHVSINTPQGLTPYDSLPHPCTAQATDLNPGGPPLPTPLPIIITYKLGAGTPTTDAPTNAGTYEVVATVNHPNYMGSATNNFTISKLAIAVKADNKARHFGAANPPLTFTYSGFMGTDTAADIDTPPTAMTTATVTSLIGQYPITFTSGLDNNYTFNFTPGTLTVVGDPVLVAWSNDFATNANLILAGSAVVTNGALRLTSTNANEAGQLLIPSTLKPLKTLHVEFDLKIGGGNSAGDGFSFNYGPDATNITAQAEEGFGTALSLLVDTFDNGGETAPGIAVRYNGALVAQSAILTLRNNVFNHFAMDAQTDGLLIVRYNNVIVASVMLSGWQPFPEWQFSVAARTAATHNDAHTIDNLLIGESAAGVILPISPGALTLALPPAFATLPSTSYGVFDNTDAAFASASVALDNTAKIVITPDVVGSATITFSGTNNTMNATVPFTVQTLAADEVKASSSAVGSNGSAQLQLSGPRGARFYLQESPLIFPPVWKTVSEGELDASGLGTALGPQVPPTESRLYRILFAK